MCEISKYRNIYSTLIAPLQFIKMKYSTLRAESSGSLHCQTIIHQCPIKIYFSLFFFLWTDEMLILILFSHCTKYHNQENITDRISAIRRLQILYGDNTNTPDIRISVIYQMSLGKLFAYWSKNIPVGKQNIERKTMIHHYKTWYFRA